VDELGDATPRCPSCLVSLEVDGTVERPHWVCPSCDIVYLTGPSAE